MTIHCGIEFIASPFAGNNGGWAIPLNNDASDELNIFFGDDPCPIAPLGGRLGYIVEPRDADNLAEFLGLLDGEC